MKNLLFITALTLPLGIFAQDNNANIQTIQNVNYYNDLDINIDNLPSNLTNQQTNPPEQTQRSSGNFFGSVTNDNTGVNTPCTDCDEVKRVLKATRHSGPGAHGRRSFNMRKWGNKFSARINMKMKKVFSHRKKIRTSHELCFNWK